MNPYIIIGIIVALGIVLQKLVQKSVKENITIDTTGITLGRYVGPFLSLKEASSTKSLFPLELHTEERQFLWENIRSVGFGKWWRIWRIAKHWYGVLFIVIQTTDSNFYIKAISPPFSRSYRYKLIDMIKTAQRENLLTAGEYKL